MCMLEIPDKLSSSAQNSGQFSQSTLPPYSQRHKAFCKITQMALLAYGLNSLRSQVQRWFPLGCMATFMNDGGGEIENVQDGF